MIRDINQNKKERKESVMIIMESNVEIYTIHQGSRESLDEYYKVFKAQVDTIDAHGGNSGYHPVVYALHLAALLEKKSIAKEDYDAKKEGLNEREIVNLLSIPMLEEAGYKVLMHTDDKWKVTTPRGEAIVFKRDCWGVQPHALHRFGRRLSAQS